MAASIRKNAESKKAVAKQPKKMGKNNSALN